MNWSMLGRKGYGHTTELCAKECWIVLAELSNFFRQLCAKELSRTMVADMERMAPVLLYKLEKIFPPDFFNLM